MPINRELKTLLVAMALLAIVYTMVTVWSLPDFDHPEIEHTGNLAAFGGTHLVYQVEPAAAIAEVKQVVDKRIWVAQLRCGVEVENNQIAITVAHTDNKEHDAAVVALVKRLVASQGKLSFKVLAWADNSTQRATVNRIAAGRQANPSEQPEAPYRWVWVRYGSLTQWDAASRELGLHSNREQAQEYYISPRDNTVYVIHHEPVVNAAIGRSGDIEVLVRDDLPEVTGLDFKVVRRGMSVDGSPAINFEVKRDASKRFADLTRGAVGRRLGIILDDQLQVAPTVMTELSTGGQITGYSGPTDRDEVLNLLQSGTLSASLTLVSEQAIDSDPAAATENGDSAASWSDKDSGFGRRVLISFAIVLPIAGVYYFSQRRRSADVPESRGR